MELPSGGLELGGREPGGDELGGRGLGGVGDGSMEFGGVEGGSPWLGMSSRGSWLGGRPSGLMARFPLISFPRFWRLGRCAAGFTRCLIFNWGEESGSGKHVHQPELFRPVSETERELAAFT